MDRISGALTTIKRRATSAGGFVLHEGGREQPDATAWACLLLAAVGEATSLVESARGWLSARQASDGRLSLDTFHPAVIWPTALALLAWQASPAFVRQRDSAGDYLVGAAGSHWKHTSDSPFGHDTDLMGWSWTEGGHAWVEPTAMALIALRMLGRHRHARVRDALALLLNRQLPRAGWNYGNTTVFGAELRPNIESTGVALHAVAGLAAQHEVESSIAYLQKQITQQSTPIALGWGLLGLHAWGIQPAETEQLIARVLTRQDARGAYDTPALCVLLLPLFRRSPLWS